jgi:hypothetical protein
VRDPGGGPTERRFTDAELEAALRDLGARIAYPRTADLLPAVRSRIEQRGGSAFWDLLRSPRLSYVPALATVALLVLATLAFQPLASTAAEALGLRGISIFRTAEVPEASGRTILADAREVGSVEEASRAIGATVRAPSALGRPEEVYVRTAGGSVQAFLVYGARSGIAASTESGVSALVTAVRGGLETQLLGKVLPAGGRAEELTVNGGRGVWIEGEPHQVFYRGPSGDILADSIRLAGNVLLWEQDGLLLRLEANVTKEQALRIASSMR